MLKPRLSWLISAVLLFAGAALLQPEWEIYSEYQDPVPGDGLLERGTSQNPYILENRNEPGERYRLMPRFPAIGPEDPILAPGTRFNPYRLEKYEHSR